MIAYFDCFAGVSGDMILGALVDVGLDLDALRSGLDGLDLPGEFTLEARKVQKHGIAATKVDVAAQEGHVHRHLGDILAILEKSALTPETAKRAGAIFQTLAEAEAHVHGTTPENVHFHEVGGVDAIVDIVGAVIGLDLLGVTAIHASALTVGTGVTQSAHGRIPIPVPAVVAMCKGVPLRRTTIARELVTPTGAAIITSLATSVGEPMTLTPVSTGYGAGTRDLDEVPNLLRVDLAQADAPAARDRVAVLEATIDDMSPEAFGYLTERILDQKARDVYLTPVYMKKGRPGTQITVLCDEADAERLGQVLLAESTTLGYRQTIADRVILPRREETVDTPYGPVRVKWTEVNGRERRAPEYEDCARIAREQSVPLLEVYRSAQQ
jgi:uncharacterized protein (TIGR00299 family) protein